MVKKFRVLRVLSATSFILGILFLFNAFSGLTGYTISEEFDSSLRSIFGVAFILVALFLFMGDKR